MKVIKEKIYGRNEENTQGRIYFRMTMQPCKQKYKSLIKTYNTEKKGLEFVMGGHDIEQKMSFTDDHKRFYPERTGESRDEMLV